MKELLIPFAFGLLLFVLGLLLIKREKRLFGDAVVTTAKLYNYYTYRSEHNSVMCSMEVEYTTEDGTVVQAREQGGSNRKKREIGAQFDICYSKEKPELFTIYGDHSRTIVLYGMVVAGLILMGLFGYLWLNQ